MFCFANDLPPISPFDSAVNDRLNKITYSKRYVDIPTNEFELKRDNNINIKKATDKFIIVKYYEEFINNGKKKLYLMKSKIIKLNR